MYDDERNENRIIAEDTSCENNYSSYYEQPEKNTSVVKILAALLLLFGVVGVLAIQYPKLVNKIAGHKLLSVSAAESIPVDGEMIADNNEEENMGDYFYNEAGGEGEGNAEGGEGGEENAEGGEVSEGGEGEGNAEGGEGGEENAEGGEEYSEDNGEDAINFDNGGEDSSLMVSLGSSGCQHPFLPRPGAKIGTNQAADLGSVPFEIIEPPTTFDVDPAINRLLEAKITGILYDKASPSAVVVIDGVDEFVKVGDKIFGYTITQITPDKVVISYGTNTFTASIGQLFSQQEMTSGRVVPNLEKKFSGSIR